MNLFDLTQEYLTVLQMAEDPDVDQQTIANTLECIEGELEDKLDGIAYIIAQIDGDINTLSKAKDSILTKVAVLTNRKTYLKKYAEEAMRLLNRSKVKTAMHNFGIQKNPPSVVLDVQCLENIPEEYLIPMDPKVDKKKTAGRPQGRERPRRHCTPGAERISPYPVNGGQIWLYQF